MHNPIEQLAHLFEAFPGIGARQAKRFAYFIIQSKETYRSELERAIQAVDEHVRQCTKSRQYFVGTENDQYAPLERDGRRDDFSLLIVEKDSDIDTIEKTRLYRGKYFVLGGTLPVHEIHHLDTHIPLEALVTLIRERKDVLQEIIIALSATPHGDHTLDFVKSHLKTLSDIGHIRISTLGRGLSIGSELEYADKETLTHALKNRS